MKRHQTLAVILALLLTGIVSNAYANPGDQVAIHDVYIGDQGPFAAGPTTNCVEYVISNADGTAKDYGNFTIEAVDKGIPPGTKYASIQAVENGVGSCFGLTANAKDRLRIVNARIKTEVASNTIIIEYHADFGQTPNGAVSFSGNMKGQFKNASGQGVTCTPANTCKVTLNTAIFSLNDNAEHSLPQVSSTNPFNGSFNVNIPSTSITVGNLERYHKAVITIQLPSTDRMLDIADSFQAPILGTPTRPADTPGKPGKHPAPDDLGPAKAPRGPFSVE